jgi:putative ABC transport system permease protein
MKFLDLIRIANRNLFRNKLRTFLTVAAIFVGSFTLTMTNGIGDGVRAYIESQVKNIESDRVILVRRKIEVPQAEEERLASQEYKDGDEGGIDFDPSSIFVTKTQIEAAVKGLDGVKSVTPRYDMAGEYITLDGEKKYKVMLAMISEGITTKTEAGASINGPGQIILPSDLAKTLDPNIGNLIGKTATIAFKTNDNEISTLPLRVVGVATKGLRTNIATFVDSSTC